MKKFLIPALLSFAVFAGCNPKADSTSTTSAGDSTSAKPEDRRDELVKANREVMHAIETGDTVVLHKYIADDAVDHAGPNGTEIKGQAIIDMLGNMHNDIDNLKIEVLQDAANDDHIFCYSRMTGTTKKPVWGMPANAKVDNASIDMIKVSGMKMTDHWSFMDPAQMMQAAAAGKAK